MTKALTLASSILILGLGLSFAAPAYAEDAPMQGDATMHKDAMPHKAKMHKASMKKHPMHKAPAMSGETMQK
jgi:pentapeptide MXKDX repeat protein